ncbi:MAG: hypothetical protein CFE44_02675 [Burkholderiales bacterium PBB4]|nr:MAG: hypothetical protein CFE44_02675 [Burkholderiales bacterium PBB4]
MLVRPKSDPVVIATISAEKKPDPVAVKDPLFSFSRGIAIKHVVGMSEQLLTLIEAGLPLDRALHISLGSLTNDRFRRVMESVVIEVEKGSTLADAFAKFPSVFPRLYVNMVRAGEEGGVLPLVIRRLVEFYVRSIEFRSFLITSSIYPAVLFVFGVSALLGLTVFVLPKFGQIFADMNQTLPLPAAILISAGEYLQQNGMYLVCILMLLVLAFLQALQKPYWLELWQRTLLRMPLIGNLILKIQLANVCRTWGTLMSSGVPILTGMRIVRSLSSNIPLTLALDKVVSAVQEGKGVATPILADPFFPRLLGQLATVGEESGALDKMLLKVADQYETDIQKATRNLVSVFEPVMILVMGGLIGTVVVSMLSAIFSINDMPL